MEKINTTQIRTGNLFLYDMGIDNEGPQWEPTALDWQDIKWCDEKGDDFNSVHKPIPLTEEWLLAFGFTHENTIGGYSKWSDYNMKLLDMKFYNESYPPRPIKYVHQLQNLYHSLTNIELTVRLEKFKVSSHQTSNEEQNSGQLQQHDVMVSLPLEQFPDTEADGIVFCDKCGKMK